MSDDLQKKIFSHNLLGYLSLSGKSQKEVADAIGVSPQTFNTWCQGIALPRMGKIQALADYFDIEKTDLLDRHDNKVKESENKPKLKIIKRDGSAQEFDISSLIYSITEAIINMPPEKQEMVYDMVEGQNKRKRKIIYVSNPNYAKPNAANERTDIEVTEEMKKDDDAFFDEED